jgi:small subunit ribosomal protein S3Ae
MAAPKGRASGRKDKWKAKNWYNLIAPDMFNRAKIAEALSDEPDKLVGRVVEVTAHDVTGDFSKMHIKLKFKVTDVRGLDAHTYFIGHDMTSDYVRRMTRRRKSKIDTTVDVTTRDDFIIRLKPLAISGRRIRSSQQSAMRVTMDKVIKDFCSKKALDEVVKSIISGQLAKNVAVACKPIQPLQRVEIRKSEILRKGFIPPAPDEPEETEEEPEPIKEPAEKAPSDEGGEEEVAEESPKKPTKKEPPVEEEKKEEPEGE